MRGILSEISLSYLAFAASLGFCFRFLARFSTDLQKRPDFIKLNSGCLCPVETISRYDMVNVPLASRPLQPKDKHIISLLLEFQTTCAMDVSEVLRTLLARALNDWPSLCVLGRIVKRQKLE